MRECEELDGKHTVFGEVVSGFAILDRINVMKTDKKEKPLVDVKIFDMKVKPIFPIKSEKNILKVFQNPYREFISEFKKILEK